MVGYSLGGTIGLRGATEPATLIGHLIAKLSGGREQRLVRLADDLIANVEAEGEG